MNDKDYVALLASYADSIQNKHDRGQMTFDRAEFLIDKLNDWYEASLGGDAE